MKIKTSEKTDLIKYTEKWKKGIDTYFKIQDKLKSGKYSDNYLEILRKQKEDVAQENRDLEKIINYLSIKYA